MTEPLSCQAARELMSPHIDGMLAPGEAALLEAHVAACAGCRAEQESLRRTIDAVRALPRLPAPPALRARIRSAVEAESGRTALGRVLAWAFPEGQGRVLLMAASLFGLAVLVGTGIYLYGPEGPPRGEERAAAPEALAPTATARPAASVAAPAPSAVAERIDRMDRAAPAAEAPVPMDRLGSLDSSAVARDEKAMRSLGYAEPALESKREKLGMDGKAKEQSELPMQSGGGQAPALLSPSASQVEEGVSKKRELQNEETARRSEVLPGSQPATVETASGTEERLQARVAPPPAAPEVELAATRLPEAPAKDARAAMEEDAKTNAGEGAPTEKVGDKTKLSAPSGRREARYGRLLYPIDTMTGEFRRNGGAAGAKDMGHIASLDLLHSTDAQSPLMRLVFPSGILRGEAGKSDDLDRWRGRAEPVPPLPPGPMSSANYQIEVKGVRCNADAPGGPGSDESPVAVRDDIEAPILDQGMTPPLTSALKGAAAVMELLVKRDGTVGGVRMVSSSEMPAGLKASVMTAVSRWRFTSARCDGHPVASVFRMQIVWRE